MKNLVFRYPQSVAFACIGLAVTVTLIAYQIILKPQKTPSTVYVAVSPAMQQVLTDK